MRVDKIKLTGFWLLCLTGLFACQGNEEKGPPPTETLPPTFTPVPSPTPLPPLKPTETPAADHPSAGVGWQAFELAQILSQHDEQGRPYYQFLDQPSMSMGLYLLAAGSTDTQSPHSEDEVYIILQGRGQFQVGDDETPFQPGDIIYVRAGVRHKFKSISEDLQTLVIFSRTPTNPEDPDWLAFTQVEVLAARNQNENVWNRFLDVTTMQFGAYLLPQALSGDRSMIHEVDEVNLVLNGRAAFEMGGDIITVQPGTMMFVEEGVLHRFRALEGDVDILILFEHRR